MSDEIKQLQEQLHSLQQTDEKMQNAVRHLALAINSQANAIERIVATLKEHDIEVDLSDVEETDLTK
jgi:hypothetical protein